MSCDYGRTFALSSQATPSIWAPLNGNVTDLMGASTLTPYGSPGYVNVAKPGYSEQAINLSNVAGGTATQYVRGSWTRVPNFTFSFWFNAQTVNGTGQLIFSAQNTITQIFISSANTLNFQYPTNGSLAAIGTPYTISASTWYYVSAIFQTDGLCSLYVNNSLIGSVTNIGGFGSYGPNNLFGLGTYDTSETAPFNGYIDDFRLYNYAIPYVPIPLNNPNIWLPFENNLAELGTSNAVYTVTPTIYLPLEGSASDSQGVSTVTPFGSPSYVTDIPAGVPGSRAISLVNTAGGAATQYVRGTWNGGPNFTVSFWFNAQTLGVNQTIFGAYAGNICSIQITNGIAAYVPSGGGNNVAFVGISSNISANTWYYVALTFQTNGLCSFYVNNALIGSVTNAQGVGSSTTTNFYLGSDTATTSAFNGLIDEVKIYNTAFVNSLVAPPTPSISVPFEGTVADTQAVSTVTAFGSPAYTTSVRAGATGAQAINLVNTAGGTVTQYLTGTWAGSSNFTVSFWFNSQTLNSTYQHIFLAYNAGIRITIADNNQLYMVVPNGGGFSEINLGFSSTLTTNTWYYATLIFQTNGLCSYYLNNTLIGSATNTGGFGSFVPTGYIINSNGLANAFNGYIDDFKLYNYAINPIPVASNPTFYLPFEGTVADIQGATAVTAFGAPAYTTSVRAGSTGIQSLNLANTAGGTATQYLRGNWNGATNFTVSFWMNPQTINGTQQEVLSLYTTGIQVVIGTDNKLHHQYPSGSGSGVAEVYTSYTLSASTWYYVTVIFQLNGACSFYVNNGLVASYTNAGLGTYTSSGNFSLGTYETATIFAFNGYIDDFRIYNAAIPYCPVPLVTPVGTISYVPGVVGLNAVNLVNTVGGTPTNYVSGSWTGSNNFTVSLWMNPSQTVTSAYQVIIDLYNGLGAITINPSGQVYAIIPSGGGFNFTTVGTSSVLSPNTWYHIHLIFKLNDTCLLYLNGALLGSVTNTQGFGSATSTSYKLGMKYDSTSPFNGYIDDLRIYNAAIPFHALQPQNYRSVALSGNAQYALASAASGWVVGSSDVQKTWSKQAVCVGPSDDLLLPNQNNLASTTWIQQGVTYTASASSELGGYDVFKAFNNEIIFGWASLSNRYNTSTGLYSGAVSTTVQGIGAVSGEWIQLRSSSPVILQTYRYACGTPQQLPKTYYIVGSNDGSSWYPIQYSNITTNPFTTSNSLLNTNILVNYNGAQSIVGNQTGSITTTSYSSTLLSYTYYRVITTATSGVYSEVVLAELYLNFAKPSPSALALSHSGQYQMVATGPAAGSIMPNQTGLVTSTWSQGGVQWGSSASTKLNPGYEAHYAFNNYYGAVAPYSWASATTYTGGSSVYGGTVSTTIQGGIGAVLGEWLQIQSSVPIVLQSYTYGCGNYLNVPRIYYVIGSMDGSNWYPLQYVAMTTNPLTANFTACTSYITTNTTGAFTISGAVTGAGTSTAYSYTTQPWMYFRFIATAVWSGTAIYEFGELYLNFTNSLSYSSNYGSTWSNQSNVITNESVALSPSGQYALSTNCVAPLARLTLDGTNVDSQGVLVPATGAGTVTYSSSVVKVGSQSAFFNNTAGGAPTNYLNYTVPAVLNTPSALTMACWVYPTALPGINGQSIAMSFNNNASTDGPMLGITTLGKAMLNYYTTTSLAIGVQSSLSIPLNTWSHLAMTFGAGSVSLYVNGIIQVTNSVTGNVSLNGGGNITNIFIGAQDTTYVVQAFAGYIDDVRLYTQALSAHEISALYSNPALTQSIGVSNSYLPITSYVKPVLPGATANVVDAKVSQTGQYMVAVTAANTNNVYYSTDYGSSFNALTIGTSSGSSVTPLARLTLDNTNVDTQGAVVPATGLGVVTYSSSVVKIGTHSAFFDNTIGGAPSTYLNYTVPAALNAPSAFTMAFWAYPTLLSGGITPLSFTNGSTVAGITFYLSQAGIAAATYSTTANTSFTNLMSAVTPSLNTWFHGAITFGGGVISLYVNGALVASASATGSLCLWGGGNFTNMVVGAERTNNGGFNGYVDDVRIYTSTLSAGDVYNLYAAPPMTACSISYDGSYLSVANASTVYTLNKNSSTYTLALGNGAGQINQASNSIAIGNLAGQTNQSANSIVLNASGSALNTSTAGFYVSPIGTTAGLPMDLLGYGADSQVVRTGVTVLPGGGFANYIGIGITNPYSRLTLANPLYPNSNNICIEAGTTSDNNNAGYSAICFNGYHNWAERLINPAKSRWRLWVDQRGVDDYMMLDVYRPDTTFSTIMKFNNNGNVGIGTNNPSSTLEVNSLSTTKLALGINVAGETYTLTSSSKNQYFTTGTAITLSTTYNNTNNAYLIDFGMYNSTNGMSNIYLGGVAGSGGNAPANFVIGRRTGTTSWAESFRIDTAGNVGIGITNPSATLHVAGSIIGASLFSSYSTTYEYGGANTAWSAGDPTGWMWGGNIFMITFKGPTGTPNTTVVRGTFLVYHSRWASGSNNWGKVDAIGTPVSVALNGITDGGLSFVFSSNFAQTVNINIVVIG